VKIKGMGILARDIATSLALFILSYFTFDRGWTILAILFAIGGTLMAAFIIWVFFFFDSD